jgi:ribosomal protein S18 acetylase RimI-like enzyme
MDLRLVPFAREHGATIVGWVTTADDAMRWASIAESPEHDVFERWHAEAGVRPFALLEAGRLTGYGEVWLDPDEAEAELARLLVAPEARGGGVGRRLVGLLVAEARRAGFERIWLRVVPSNEPALACYRAAGFEPVSRTLEARFNAGQPRRYVWMSSRHA